MSDLDPEAVTVALIGTATVFGAVAVALFTDAKWGTIVRTAADILKAIPLLFNPTMQRVNRHIQNEVNVVHGNPDDSDSESYPDLDNTPSPLLWPTKEEVEQVLADRKYDPNLLHFCICGPSGSGKSALINALRGLTSKDPESAKSDVVETTTVITRYPDTRTGTPFERFVWYDIPGAGTEDTPAAQYFIDQGLYVFDFIILVWGDRWTEIDAGIVEHAKRFQVPVFVVRSKTDVHVENMMKDERGDEEEVEDTEDEEEKESAEMIKERERKLREERERKLKKECLHRYEEVTRKDFEEKVRRMKSQDDGEDLCVPKRVYLVSAHTLRKLMKRMSESNRNVEGSTMIDEKILLKDMVKIALERRYGKTFAWFKQKVGTVKDAVSGLT